MRFLDRIVEAGRKLDRAVYRRTRLDRAVAAIKPKIPPSIARFSQRYGAVVAGVALVAMYATAFSTVGRDAPAPPSLAAQPTAPGDPEAIPTPAEAGAAAITERPPGSPLPVLATPSLPGTKGGDQRPTVNVCGAKDVIRTGSQVQFPWAPQCVSDFTGTNGGATARGITADTIRVAYYVTQDPVIIGATKAAGGCGSEECIRDYATAYAEWFQRYYQTYGRKLEIVFVNGSGRENDVTAAVNDARRIASIDPPVFAALAGPGEAGAAYGEELASRGVLCFCTTSLPQEFYEEHSPYVWSTLMASTQAYVHRAEYIGKRLAGRKAQWAGTDALRARERNFALVWFDNDRGDYAPGVEFFEKELARYDVELVRKIRYTNIEGCQADSTNIATQLVAADVTTVVFSGDPVCPISLTKAAEGQQAKWEWFITGSALTDTNNFGRLYDQNQWSRAFGVSMLEPDVLNANTYWYKMYLEIRGKDAVAPKEEAPVVLSPFTNFFIGVHLGGPALTPDTFKAGMARYVGRGGTVTIPLRTFGPKRVSGLSLFDFNGYDDMTEIWWDRSAQDPNGRNGAYRYVDGGHRYQWGEWPSSKPRAFDPDGTTVGYKEAPDQ